MTTNLNRWEQIAENFAKKTRRNPGLVIKLSNEDGLLKYHATNTDWEESLDNIIDTAGKFTKRGEQELMAKSNPVIADTFKSIGDVVRRKIDIAIPFGSFINHVRSSSQARFAQLDIKNPNDEVFSHINIAMKNLIGKVTKTCYEKPELQNIDVYY